MTLPMKVAIIGAGPVGMTTALILSKLGYKITLFEKRSKYTDTDIGDKRSINLTLSERGLKALRIIGLEQKILNRSVPIIGREVHRNGKKSFLQPYGRNFEYSLCSITRRDLTKILYSECVTNENLSFKFDSPVEKILPNNFQTIHSILLSAQTGLTLH